MAGRGNGRGSQREFGQIQADLKNLQAGLDEHKLKFNNFTRDSYVFMGKTTKLLAEQKVQIEDTEKGLEEHKEGHWHWFTAIIGISGVVSGIVAFLLRR